MGKKISLLVKRLFDIVSSVLGIILLSPLLIIVALLIRVNLGSPIFFIQERIGKENKIFKLIKFRTMKSIKDKDGKEKDDSLRMTKFGKVLRSLSIDELPELINILKGEMSLIGPRPLLVEYLSLYDEEQIKRHNVLPGLTGLAQVNGRNNLSWTDRFKLDVEYVENWSLLLDINIFFKTFVKLFKREGISKEGMATKDRFMGSNSKKTKDIVIIGAGGFGREVAWLIEEINEANSEWNLLGFIDENKDNIGKVSYGYKILGDLNYFKDKNNLYYVCAIGNATSRKKIIEKCYKYNIKAAILIHPSVMFQRKLVDISEGAIICAGNILTTNIKIKRHAIINLSCTIGHDVIIDEFVTLYPGVNLSGNCSVGTSTELGTGSKVIQGKSIGSDCVIGAGAVVINDIKDGCTAVGVPAKVIKYRVDD